jgi:N12 class adenine-specific DNA methylase
MSGPVTRARASLRALEALDRLSGPGAASSPDDMEDLRGWSGWGPLAAAFAPNRSGAWREIGERIEWLLPPDQLAEAHQATPNAFYTPPALAEACWQILTDLGFTGGKILEPGCGAGVFMAAAPPGVAAAWTGVERDPVTARIAALLHPAVEIIGERLQNAPLAAHSMDAVIGNVPFANVAVYDPTAPKPVAKSLHNYCIWRSVKSLRPGGIAVLITSRYTLDAKEMAARAAIGAEADLVGAIRLPSSALAAGGTEALADILVLRRRDHETDEFPAGWQVSVPIMQVFPTRRWEYEEHLNQWFVTHPDMVLGELQPDHAPLYGRTLRVDRPAGAGPVEAAVAEASAWLVARAKAEGLTWLPSPALAQSVGDVGIPQRADGRKEASFHLVDGAVVQVRDGLLVPVGERGRVPAELTSLIRLRDATVALLDAEADHGRSDESLSPLRAKLNAVYDQYAARYGPLNRASVSTGEPDPETGLATVTRRRPRMGGFRQDPDYVTVLALENYDDETGQAAKTAIFAQRVNQVPSRPDHADTPAEAIRICLDSQARLDLLVVGRLLGIAAEDVPARLAGLAYLDPESGSWVTAEEYLSGDVRAKLAAANAVGGAGEQAANVAALEQMQPADLGPDEIRAKLGAPWIPPGDIRAFASDLLGYSPEVTYQPVIAQWELKIDRGKTDTAAATEEWGTGRADGYRLLELALNGKAPVIYDTVETPNGQIRERNDDETMLAEEKQRALGARFSEWAWEEPQRADRLAAEYNRRFNSVVLRRYDGSHLTFPGLAAGFTPYPHQLDMVHRIVSTPASLCPYPVGTGKTPTMFLAARKLRELGLATKPLIIVPNHLLEQTAREGKRLFPAAKILTAAREDLSDARARKLFAARCATGDWDAVVMTHSAFTAIPVHPVAQAAYLADLAARYRQALNLDPKGGSRTVKQLAKAIDGFETQARRLLDHRTDDGVWFHHLGADLLMVDEAHYFKNLGLPVHTDGFTVAASKRASDLDMKLDQLRQRGGKVAALFTGTPVSNSLLEMYVLQHYLHPARLEEIGLNSADSWAATFVEFQTTVEVTPDGTGFRLKRRPVKFENLPELLTLFGEVADLRPPGSFALQRPEARAHNVLISPSPELRDYVAGLAERADNLRAADPHDDNMLKICSDGRKAALDLRMVGVETSRPGKAGAVIANVARIYHANRDLVLPGDSPGVLHGGFQIVFCDLGTPNTVSSQVYGRIRAGLVAAGVPAGRVRFIHDAATDQAKAALFAACRSGQVSVLLGSTDKLGVGTNIQTRCVALHHVDAPWRPADVEQREGRALRPGNLNPAVELYRYVTEKSFDSFMWQALERKARFVGQVLSGRPAGRDVDDIGDATLSYAEVKALATGNPLLMELAEVNAEVTRLRQLASGHLRGARRLTDSVRGWQIQAGRKDKAASEYDRIAAILARSTDTAWYDERRRPIRDDAVAGHLADLVGKVATGELTYPEATWRGLNVCFDAQREWRDVRLFARISAGTARITVPLNPVWTAQGQHWRILREIKSGIDQAPGTAGDLRAEAEDLRQRIADAERRIGEPFAHAADLEAARARRDAIEQAIRDAAAPPAGGAKPDVDGEAETPPGGEQENGEVYAIEAIGAPEDAERVTITAVRAWQAEADIDDQPAPATSAAWADGEVRPGDVPGGPEVPATGPVVQPTPAVLARVVRGSADPGLAAKHPAALARLDRIAEPLFARPDPAPQNPAATETPARRAAAAQGARAPAGQAVNAAAIQDALFDVPAVPPRPARTRRRTRRPPAR